MKTENLTDKNIQEVEKIDNRFKVNVGNLLEGKVAVITGCSSGIGAATTKVFLEAGAKVFGCYYSQADERLYPNAINDMRKFSEENGYQKNFMALDLDIADIEGTPRKLVEGAVDNFGRIDILCNFAGIAYFNKFEEMTREKYKRTMDVNLNGHVFLTQMVVEEMKKNELEYEGSSKGSIINMSSMTGPYMGEDGVVDYGITKAALLGFTNELVTELGPYKIRVNSIHPGSILTPIQIRDYKDENRRRKIENRTAIKRWGFPREVANVALFLASDLSSYVTGTEIRIDGGMTKIFQLE